MPLKSLSLVPVLAVLIAMTAQAQSIIAEEEAGEPQKAREGTEGIEELVVKASRMGKSAKSLPIKVDVFQEDEIRLQQTLASNPVEMLSNLIPSFAPSRQKLTGSGETFRGRTPLYLVDGIPQSTPLRPGAREGFTIDMEVIERIEVIFGANAIQGLGGTGGVINYVTVSPPESGELHQRASFSMTNNDDFDSDGFGWRGHYLAAKRFGQFDTTAAVSYEERGLQFDAEDRPIAIANMDGDIADSHSRNFFGKFGYEPDENQRYQLMFNDFYLEQDGHYVPVDGDRNLGIPATSVDGDPEGELPFNDVTNVSFDYTHSAFFGGTFAAQVYYKDFKSLFGGDIVASFQDPAIAPVGTLFEQSQNNSEKTGARLTYGMTDVGGTSVDIITGLDYLQDETSQPLVVTGRVSVPPTTFDNYAPFVQVDTQPLNWLSLSGGVRWEFADLEVPDYTTRAGNRPDFQTVDVEGGKRSFDDVLYNFGAVFNTTDELSFYASYSEAFSMPDVGRVLRSVSEFGTRVDTLLDIGPLVTENREVGGAYRTARGEIRLTYFESQSDFGSRLVARPDGTFDLARQATETSGWELSGRIQLSSWLALGGGYSKLDGQFDSDDDNEPDADLGARDIGPDRLSLSLDITPAGRYSGSIQAFTFFDKTFHNAAGAETASFDGYTTMDAVIAADLDNTTISLSISNLFDEQYITYFGQAATTADSLYYAGRGRLITLRAETAF